MAVGQLKVSTTAGMELIDITRQVEIVAVNASISRGVIHLFCPHTTAGLTINEGADPDVRRDIVSGLQHIVPRNLDYKHAEGNSPAHLMTLLTGGSLTLFIENGTILLGTWQKIFFCEFDGPRTRTIHWKIIADAS